MSATTITPPDALNATDRCMCTCSARAMVRVAVPLASGEELMVDYCGHHFATHETGLDSSAARIIEDIREGSTAVDTDEPVAY